MSSAPSPKGRRVTLDALAKGAAVPQATEALVETRQEPAAPPPAPPEAVAPAARSGSSRDKYPSATVYLPKKAIRLIKEISLEEDRRISDILAEAVDEYLTRRGHPSLEQLSK
ncbi:hypothetical protein CCR97_00300 [Rhodoplanes elegans]|uniref:CopG family transcriptional regulator n=1 Tax=Rhodoplanes elegans TaxID=29408 RepID=A0A327KKC9_9BRAD|nr:hypothetical protein [Rhodoplanes elegans]MBK5956678.1 hypothetical protein [Rhodoplanes elegans]RAI39189.1 hypothetical protein CH338_10185 [Rhodoplanes elegans]